MEGLAFAASVVGVVGPALHCVRQLVDDIQKIVDAPSAVKALKDDLTTIDEALTSLQTISDYQWESLGETVVNQTKAATNLCTQSCEKFRSAIGRWTRHSDVGGGKLSWRDRAMVGFFKQSQLKSTAEQLQNCKSTLTWVVSIAVL
ncbi:hypothetical protein CONLIGDRAFT_634325 [Coniochaeta ligniaria NRRL 30616]|uniref:Azaphilone pigments biosynthesis cluster protein L N-terminal domain-containing protein n=1 Tax=Coniochaeta ligniaria NRRL 30616 TaxID=1408157 RepID=A0A1J7JFG7_9PEZI|nr:hypothetical protein CONLIGDRAFT_634325 [Coniochaeta ligniaria NRRL 30616]